MNIYAHSFFGVNFKSDGYTSVYLSRLQCASVGFCFKIMILILAEI